MKQIALILFVFFIGCHQPVTVPVEILSSGIGTINIPVKIDTPYEIPVQSVSVVPAVSGKNDSDIITEVIVPPSSEPTKIQVYKRELSMGRRILNKIQQKKQDSISVVSSHKNVVAAVESDFSPETSVIASGGKYYDVLPKPSAPANGCRFSP